jgi:DNA invertase Pin-like site-specific DNA recombinase
VAEVADIRRRLDSLGRRRARIDADEAKLMAETEELLREARGIVPVSEAAKRLRIHRTTVYRVYRPHAA